MTGRNIHEGRNIRRFRELLHIKQETLAREMGNGWDEQKINQLELSETIEDAILTQVAEALKLPASALKELEEEQTVNIIANTFEDVSIAFAYNCHFNPLDKILDMYEEHILIYKNMLQEKEEEVTRLEALLGKQS